MHDVPGEHRSDFDLPAVAVASFGDEYPIWHAPFDCDVRYVAFVMGEGGLAGGGNYTNVVVRNKGTDGTGTTVLETTAFSAAANEFDSYYVYNPATYLAVDSGTVLSIAYAVGGGVGENMPRVHGYVAYEGR